MFFRPLLIIWAALSFSFLQASEIDIATQIIDKTLNSLFPNKTSVKTWADTTYHKEVIKHSENMQLANSEKEAEFYLIEKKLPKTIKKNVLIFTTNIDLFYDNDQVIGAFYWQKGRPNLIFLRERLKKYNIKLSSEFENYIEDSL